MEKFMKKPSEEYKNAVSVLRQLLLAEGENAASRAFAEVVHEARKSNFCEMHKITPRRDSHVCIHRLLERKCPNDKCLSPQMIPGSDHCSEWQKDGQTIIVVSQPYSLGYQDIKDTVKFCEENELEANIEASSSWHFPGRTINIEYRQAKEKG